MYSTQFCCIIHQSSLKSQVSIENENYNSTAAKRLSQSMFYMFTDCERQNATKPTIDFYLGRERMNEKLIFQYDDFVVSPKRRGWRGENVLFSIIPLIIFTGATGDIHNLLLSILNKRQIYLGYLHLVVGNCTFNAANQVLTPLASFREQLVWNRTK